MKVLVICSQFSISEMDYAALPHPMAELKQFPAGMYEAKYEDWQNCYIVTFAPGFVSEVSSEEVIENPNPLIFAIFGVEE